MQTEGEKMLKITEKIINGETPTLCFFGDSVTHGDFEIINGNGDCMWRPDLVYHKLLADRIRAEYRKEITVVNAGVGGNFSADGLRRIQSDVLDKKPDFCLVMFGTNDVTKTKFDSSGLIGYKLNMRAIITKLKMQGIETAVMTPGMLCSRPVPGFTGIWSSVHIYFEYLQKSGQMDQYAEALREVAKETDIPVADAYAEWKRLERNGVDTTALLANGLNHPNAEMHKVFADKLFELIFN